MIYKALSLIFFCIIIGCGTSSVSFSEQLISRSSDDADSDEEPFRPYISVWPTTNADEIISLPTSE